MSAETNHNEADDALILSLATGLSWRRAAKQTGVSPATVGRRMKEPRFRQLVTERRAELLNEVSGKLTGLMRQAAATLKKLLTSKSDVVRLGACRVILESAVSIRSVVEFEERLASLEGKSK